MTNQELKEIDEQFQAMADAEDAFNVAGFIPDLTAEARRLNAENAKLRKVAEAMNDHFTEHLDCYCLYEEECDPCTERKEFAIQSLKEAGFGDE